MIPSPYCGQERYDVKCVCGVAERCVCSCSFIEPKNSKNEK